MKCSLKYTPLPSTERTVESFWGKPFVIRFFTGLKRPKLAVTGTDFAGRIEAVGKDVTLFKEGERVMGFGGMGISSHAEHLVLPETEAIVTIPEQQDYAEAAACMEGAFYAACGVRGLQPRPDQKALVYGATGAIGSATVQFLKYYGTYVTAVCSGEHRKLVQSLGADRIIDLKTEDFTKDQERYDFVIDAVGKSSFGKCKILLKDKGIYSSSDGFENLFLALVTSLSGGKKVVFDLPKNVKEGLIFIKGLVEKGKFKPLIDRSYPMDKVKEAFYYVNSGQKTGNVILTVDT